MIMDIVNLFLSVFLNFPIITYRKSVNRKSGRMGNFFDSIYLIETS